MIELKDICKSFGDHVVLKNFSLKINKNEFIAIIGESGAGKTTILNMISMIDKPDSGSISINGKNSFFLFVFFFFFCFWVYFSKLCLDRK